MTVPNNSNMPPLRIVAPLSLAPLSNFKVPPLTTVLTAAPPDEMIKIVPVETVLPLVVPPDDTSSSMLPPPDAGRSSVPPDRP